MNLFKTLISLIAFFTSTALVAQNYNMSNGTTITTCSGNFYDSGGAGGNYGNSQTYTFTICPDTPGSMAEVDFTNFNIEDSWDFLTIYDGDNTGATTLGTYTGINGPGFVSATGGNPTGCLTFVFESDGSFTEFGWEAVISCSVPCQTINSQLDSSNPTADGDGIIRVCQGESVTFNGSGTFSNSGAGATYEWDFNDGSTGNGTSVSHTYNDEGAYLVNLTITDPDGCTNDNLINQVVQVSSTPIFAGTTMAETEICLGETNVLTGVVAPVEVIKECTPPVSGQTFLPDGSGVSYETSVTVDCFDPSQTITSPDDIQDVCIDIEHSYIGDLDIVLICPNGQEMAIMQYPNGGGTTYLGNPWDGLDQANGAGDGLTYCFDNNATGTLVNGPTQAANNTAGNTISPGTYAPEGSFNDLVGCPLNGDWTIEITDNLGSDDGYIFEWALNFEGSIIPGDFSFTPTVVNEQWQNDPTIVSITGNQITVEPTSAGTSCYTYEMTDNFGCTYDTTICFDVLPAPVIDPIADVSQCAPYTLPAITGTDLTGGEAYYTGTGGTGTQYAPGDVISTSTTIYIYDEMAVSPFCSDEESFVITIINSVLTITCPPNENAVCDISEVPPYANFADFQNAGGSANSTDANVLTGTFTLVSEVSDNNTCPETITRTYQIEDDCGNIETCTQTIIIDDNINPTGTAPSPVSVQCIGDVPAADPTLITDEADNCSAPTVTHVGDVSDNGTCPEIITRTYRIEDACGNFIEVDQIITVDDTQNPTGTAPAPIAVQCTGDIPVADPTLIIDEADNCSVPTVTYVGDATDGNTCPEIITRTYRIEDACGNFIEVDQIITVDDTQNPTGTAPAPIAVQCIGDIPVADPTLITDEADNCSAPTVTHVGDVSDGNTCPELITRTYRIEDACGNFIEVDQIITVDDTQNPTGTAPAPIAVQCIGDVPVADLTLITDEADNCSAPTVTHVGDVSDGNTCPELITRTYRIEDACGNFIEVDQIITVDDTQNPTGTAPAPIAVQCIGDVPVADPTLITDEADNCTVNPTVTHVSDVSDNGTCPEIITRTYEITDDCGNSITVTQQITIDDTQNPTASNPAPMSSTGSAPAPDITVVDDEADNCTTNPTVAFVSDVSDGNNCPETVIRTYSVTDDCGNQILVEQTITIGDAIIPTASNPAPISVQCIGDVPAPDPIVVTDETDNGATPIVTWEDDTSDGNTCPETITRRYRVTDDCGNFIFVEQTITVNDDIAPTGTAPAPIVVQCIGDVPVADPTLITDEADNCSVNPIVTHVGDATDGNTCPETITRTYRIEDDCGNTTDVTQTITVNDDISPTGTGPAPIAVQCIGDVPASDPTLITDEADNCTANPTVTYVGDASDGNTCPETITRTYRIEDDCGNTTDITQTITVNDDINPTGTVPAPIAVQCIGDVPAADPTLITDEADNCTVNPIVTHVGDASDGNTCPETITRTYRIEDDCGNFIEVDQTITVDDDINPTGTAPAPMAVQCIGDLPASDPTLITDAADNCTVAPTVIHVGDASDGNTCPEIITRTYRIEDECGNLLEVDQTITVNDDIAPTASNPASTTVECATDVPATDPVVVTDEVDNCTVTPTVTFISEISDNNVCNGEQLTRTYEIADDCGNITTVTHTIIIDSYTPAFSVAGTDPTVCGGNDGFITISGLDPNTDYTFEFNGGAQTTITTDGAGEYVATGLGAGSYTGFTVSDADCPGCSTTDGQTITLTDPNPPAVSAGVDQQVCDGTAVTLTADNPDGAIISWDNGVVDGSPFTSGVGTITYTVTADLAGCINTDQVDVTVYAVPVIDPLADQEECDSYTLPAITGTNLTGSEAYYIGAGGTGTQLNPSDVINTAGITTLYIYDETGTTPNCSDEQTFDVTINLTPVIDPLADQVECDSYTLPAITGVNLTGNEAYYDAPNGGGTQYNAGDAYTTAGATTLYIYDETGTTPNCSDEQTFDVTINLTPAIDPLADQVECDSYTLPAITGVNLTGNEAYYDVLNGSGTQYNAGDVITTAGTTTLYIYDETGTAPNCSDEQTFDVTINITPVIDPLANQEECDSYALPTITGVNLTGNEAYYDTPNGGGTQYNAGDVITTAGTTTLYIYDETGTAPNCFDEQTFDVTINITPTFTLASTDPTACGAADGAITISGLEPNTAYDVTYTEGGGIPLGTNTMNSDATGDIVIGGLTAGSYSDFIVTLNGCTTTDNSSINLVDPNAPAVNAGTDQEVCEGEDVILTADNPDGANISWNNGVTDGTPFSPGVGTVTYTVTADLLGCISTDQVEVTVNLLPNVNAGNDIEICEGEQVVLTGNGADSYTWDNGVVNGQSFTPNPTTTYTVTGSTLDCENTDDVLVTVVENPTVVFEADTTQGCVPLTVNFSNLTQGNIDNCTYTFSDGAVLNGCDITHTFNQSGCYDVTLEVENTTGCISTTTIQDYICVESYPIADFQVEPGQITNIFNQTNFTNSSVGGSTYEWSFGDGETSSNTNPSHIYDTESGEEEYEVILVATSEYDCSDTATTVIPVIEELIFHVPNSFTPDEDIHNPTFKPVFVSGFDPQDYTLLIFNRWGEVIFESRNANIGWDGTYGVESNEIVRDGTYVWKIEFKTKYTDERKVEVGHVNVLR